MGMPFSKPDPGQGFIRITSNLYQFQVNYVILFLIQLGVSIFFDPNALLTMVVIGLVWMVFLKKNDDPNWQPEIAGMPLGPTQRMIILAGITLLIMLIVAGNTVFWQGVMFAIAVVAHGVLHEVQAGPVANAGDGVGSVSL